MTQVEIPLTSREVAQQTYQEYVADPKHFIRSIVAQLEQDDPSYLDGELAGAVTVALEEHSKSAQRILGGSFFRYACSDRETKRKGQKLPSLATSFEKTLEEVTRLTEGVHKAGTGIGAVARQMAMRLERNDPEIGKIIRGLVELPIATFRIEGIDAFVQGVHNTHLHLMFLDTDAVLSPVISEIKPSPLPLVSRSIVRTGLLEAVLESNNFIINTMEESYKHAPGLVKRIMIATANRSLRNHHYLLLSSFEIFCFMREFQQRREMFPAISMEDRISHPDPEIDRMIKSGDDSEELSRRLADYSAKILQEIGDTNPHLSWGINSLLNPLTGKRREEFTAAVDGVVHQYSTLKAKKGKVNLSLIRQA